ncbi:unnamed protein product [Malus baccata var. baccata]
MCCHIPARVHHIPGPLHHRSTILFALGLPFPHGFVFGNSQATSQWVIHPGSALDSFSLNFEVPTQPEASELPKSLVLARVHHIPGLLHHRSTILSALGPDYALTVLFLGTHKQLPSRSPILGVLWLHSRLTSKFLRNSKPVSSQKASC